MSASRSETVAGRQSLLLAWTRQRFGLARFLPLAALVVLCGSVGDALAGGRLGRDLAVTLTALFAWRLLDDLSSRDVDRGRHPDRVAVLASEVGVARLHAAALAIAALSALVAVVPRVGVAPLVLVGVTAGVVGWGRLRSTDPLLVTLGTLLKYPLLLLAVRFPDRGLDVAFLSASVGLYAAMLAFDLLDDAQHREDPRAGPLLLSALLALFAALLGIGGAITPLARTMLIPAVVLLLFTWRARRSPRMAHAPLVVLLAVTVSQSIWRTP